MRNKSSDVYYIVMKKDAAGEIILFPERRSQPDIICDVESGCVFMPHRLAPTPGKYLDDPDYAVFGPFKKSKRLFFEYQGSQNLKLGKHFFRLRLAPKEMDDVWAAQELFAHDREFCLKADLEGLYYKKIEPNPSLANRLASSVPTTTHASVQPYSFKGNYTPLEPRPHRPTTLRTNDVIAAISFAPTEPGGQQPTLNEAIQRALRTAMARRRNGLRL